MRDMCSPNLKGWRVTLGIRPQHMSRTRVRSYPAVFGTGAKCMAPAFMQ